MNNINAGVVAVFVLVVALVVAQPVVSYSTVGTETFTVNDKELVCESRGDCKYLIFTDKGVYQNTDALLHLKFNSSDVYAQLEKGVEYEARTHMFRFTFLSMYPNILQVREVK